VDADVNADANHSQETVTADVVQLSGRSRRATAKSPPAPQVGPKPGLVHVDPRILPPAIAPEKPAPSYSNGDPLAVPPFKKLPLGASNGPSSGTLEKWEKANKAAGVLKNGKITPAQVAAFLDYIREVYRFRPVQFVEDYVTWRYPDFELDVWQKRLLNDIAHGKRRISVKAGHGVGKTFDLAVAAIHFMFTRHPQRTVITAPTASQLFDALFAEIRIWVNELPPVLRAAIEVFSDRIELKAAPDANYMSARTSSADKPEAMAGVHSANVLLIADEASGIPESVFEAAVGSMSGENATTVLLGNPTRNSGMFFKTHHQLKENWETYTVSCLDCKRVDRDFIKQIADTYGENSNQYRVRVLGEFAVREDDALIPAELVDAAMVREIVTDPREPLVYGLDVARFGDDRCALAKRRGSVLIEIKKWTHADLMETTGRVAHEAALDHPAEILVDSIGLGSGVADRLRELGFNVRDVNVSESSAMNPQAARLRDELWLSLKEWLAARACKIPKDDDLKAELCGPTYTFQSNGKIKVEGKQDLKRRGLRSPDMADALCLTFAGMAAFVGGRASKWITGKPLKRTIRGIV
jgi:phage terminase large subunit